MQQNSRLADDYEDSDNQQQFEDANDQQEYGQDYMDEENLAGE